MDNTFFGSITDAVTTNVGFALTAVVTVCALILGATVGYRVYKRFLG